jgi:hypothetical protein
MSLIPEHSEETKRQLSQKYGSVLPTGSENLAITTDIIAVTGSVSPPAVNQIRHDFDLPPTSDPLQRARPFLIEVGTEPRTKFKSVNLWGHRRRPSRHDLPSESLAVLINFLEKTERPAPGRPIKWYAPNPEVPNNPFLPEKKDLND